MTLANEAFGKLEEFRNRYKLDAKAGSWPGNLICDMTQIASAEKGIAAPLLEIMINVLMSATANSKQTYDPIPGVCNIANLLASSSQKKPSPDFSRVYETAKSLGDRLADSERYIETILNTASYLRS
jgi:hypothetical protein